MKSLERVSVTLFRTNLRLARETLAGPKILPKITEDMNRVGCQTRLYRLSNAHHQAR
jgi:hypothetical protein